ncbi:MAG: hypothetical protein FWD61_14305, partial [Phycisphaerales bacterium]|nr:hypothetical protein [Phycisphaerales bacterium]
KGGDPPHISGGTRDSMFPSTPKQGREGREKRGGGGISQRYPIGLLVKGTTFEAMPLDVGHTVDDYVNEKVIQDWVFQLDPNEKPLFVEVKQLARVPVSATDKPLAKKEADAYPQQAYKESAGSIAVTVLDENNKPMAHVTVRLVPRSLDVNKVQTAMANAHSHIEDALSSDEGAWAPAFGKPGVPSRDKMSQANRDGNVGNAPVIGWRPLVTLLMLGETQPNGERNHSAMPAYFQSNIVPIITPEQRGESAKTGADGKVILPKVAPVDYCLIADGKTEAGSYCVWVADVEVKKKTETRKDLKPSEAAYLLTPVR